MIRGHLKKGRAQEHDTCFKAPLCPKNERILSPPSLSSLYSPFCYSGSVGATIRDCKQHRTRTPLPSVQRYVREYATEFLPESAWDFILPLPARWRSIRERGFHIPLMIAEELSRVCNGRSLTFLEKHTLIFPPWHVLQTPQKFLTKELRAKRAPVRPSILLGRRLTDGSILLVDDVMTTGKTLEGAAKAILPFLPGRLEAFCLVHSHDTQIE